MSFWKNLSIRKKLSYSILGLTTLLALTAGITSGIKLRSAQTDALWAKGKGLSAVLAEAVTSSFLSDDLGTTVGATDRLVHNFVDQAKCLQSVGRDAQGIGGVLGLFRRFPQN